MSRERPILFSSQMVRAILAGTKTQTRRVAKIDDVANGKPVQWVSVAPCTTGIMEVRCPYGEPGDRLWVRETFIHEPADYCWEASVSIPCRPASTVYRADHEGDTRGAGWTPSIHMPRSLSRITLEITGVRVERLQKISEADAIAEGIERGNGFPGWYRGPLAGDSSALVESGRKFKIPTAFPRLAYRALWESINGPSSWKANPFVWVVEFRRLERKGCVPRLERR